MASKTTLIILFLCFAFVLLVSSEASRDLAETTSKGSDETKSVADAKYVHIGGPKDPQPYGGPEDPQAYGGAEDPQPYGGPEYPQPYATKP